MLFQYTFIREIYTVRVSIQFSRSYRVWWEYDAVSQIYRTALIPSVEHSLLFNDQ